ncbi:MAG: M28 family peptidase [Nocardioides sp.]|nr:M28 family peptidase [Nocardioides sp.]
MRTAAALLCVGVAAVACTTPAGPPRERPEPSFATSTPTPTPTPKSAGPAYGLFDPDLDDAEPVATTVSADAVVTTYEWTGSVGFTVTQQPDPARDLCAALAPRRMAGDTCTVADGVMVTRMEEFSGVALVREGTLLFASSLLTEGDDGLLERATEALRTAPVAGLEDLGDVTEGEEQPAAAATPPISPDDLDPTTAVETVRHLAGVIGPREATGPGYERAARWVEGRFDLLGYSVRRQRIDVPAGSSWGVPVTAGRSVNVIAWPPGFTPEQPHLVVSAHLDTVAQAPGAEDNASGVGVLLAAAQAAASYRTRLPVVFVAFGAEEPRGPTDADHHYGSRTYVAELPARQRRAVRGMVSLDRVGVGDVVPIGSGRDGPDRVADQLAEAAGVSGVRTVRESNRSSDHWQFVLAGLPGARLGSTPYAGYHSPADVPAVVQPAQLERVGRIVLEWLAPG